MSLGPGELARVIDAGPAVRVDIAGDRAPLDTAAEAAIDALWDIRAAANPRLFNGPVLSFAGFMRTTGAIEAWRDEYRRLVCQQAGDGVEPIDTGLVQLSVTGVLLARDEAGFEHVLLGRRAAATRIYANMWELAPSGGVDPPGKSVTTLDEMDLWRALRLEITEELDLPVEPNPGEVVALAEDRHARSCDVVFRVPLVRHVEELVAMGSTEPGASRWEYDSVRWVATDELAAFISTEPVIPPTAALFRHFGWA